jgi:hypothetical protein
LQNKSDFFLLFRFLLSNPPLF